jgi:hypothetical protein
VVKAFFTYVTTPGSAFAVPQWGLGPHRGVLLGEDRTARRLGRQAMHEGIHHLGDIRRVGGISGLPAADNGVDQEFGSEQVFT